MNKTNINQKDVQAIFRGFDKRWELGRFFYCRYESSDAGRHLMQWILDHQGSLTSYHDLDDYPDVAVNVAFTFDGLQKLGLTPDVLQSFPGDFRQGMIRRAELNGDVGNSNPEEWEEIWRKQGRVHVWIGVYAKSPALLEDWARSLEAAVGQLAVEFYSGEWEEKNEKRSLLPMLMSSMFLERVPRSDFGTGLAAGDPPVTIVGTQDVKRFWSEPDIPMYIDDPATNPNGSVVLEHFGFRDGVSQPVIDGLDEDKAKVRGTLAGGGKLTDEGKWESLATGEFLLGYVDEMGEIPIAPVPPTLALNGSFMVQRKLYQDVDEFRRYLKEKSRNVSSRSGEAITADYLAAKMMGRERNGMPLAYAEGLNDFRYADDLQGSKCPLGAHMRRANPRDAMCMERKVAVKFGSILTNRHRILRRGITYGDPVPTQDKQEEINPDGQGLMFISLQSNISNQFEFVQQEWINFGNDLNQGNDRDPVVGNQDGEGRMTIPGDGDKPTVICGKLPRFVRTCGGDYFFLPGINAFDLLVEKRNTQTNIKE